VCFRSFVIEFSNKTTIMLFKELCFSAVYRFIKLETLGKLVTEQEARSGVAYQFHIYSNWQPIYNLIGKRST